MLKVYYNEKSKRNNYYDGMSTGSYARLVAKQNPEICGEWFEGCEVHHINFKSNDDRPENLIVITKDEHHKIHSTPVDVYYKNKYIGRYASMSEAEKDNNLYGGVISYYCKHNKPISPKYKYWRFHKFVLQ